MNKIDREAVKWLRAVCDSGKYPLGPAPSRARDASDSAQLLHYSYTKDQALVAFGMIAAMIETGDA